MAAPPAATESPLSLNLQTIAFGAVYLVLPVLAGLTLPVVKIALTMATSDFFRLPLLSVAGKKPKRSFAQPGAFAPE